MDRKGEFSRYQGWSLDDRDPHIINSWMPVLEWFYHHYFRVQTDGWHHIPDDQDQKVLFVGSHNGGLAAPDLLMFAYDWYRRFGVERPVYGLTHPKIWQAAPFLGALGSQVGAVQAHPKMAIAAFRQGAHVLVYPGGAQDTFRPHHLRDKIYFANRKGFIKLALREGVPIVPLISWGAHDTLIVLGDCYEQARYLNELGFPWLMNIDPEVFPIYLGLPWGIGLGALPNIPLPTQIHTRVCEPITFEHYGREWVKDEAYVEACYGQVVAQMQADLDRLVAIA